MLQLNEGWSQKENTNKGRVLPWRKGFPVTRAHDAREFTPFRVDRALTFPTAMGLLALGVLAEACDPDARDPTVSDSANHGGHFCKESHHGRPARSDLVAAEYTIVTETNSV